MGPEWIVVAVVAVIVIFGVNKLPQIARNVGKAQSEFKKGLKEGATEEDLAGQQPATPTTPPAAGAPTDIPPAASPATPPPTSEAPTPRPADQPPTEQNP
jgi:sec-independent protein translocase protein TatA